MRNITDYIKIYKDVLSERFCKALILKASTNEDDWVEAKSMSGRDKYRSAKFFTQIDRVYKNKKGGTFNFDPALFTVTGNLLKRYQKTFGGLDIQNDEGYKLLRYRVGDYHTEHVDSCIQSKPRILSMLFMCSNGFKGGDLIFFGEHVVSLGVGDAVIFPSSFMFPHKVSPITKGTRYVISTFCY